MAPSRKRQKGAKPSSAADGSRELEEGRKPSKRSKTASTSSDEGLQWLLGEAASVEEFRERYFEREPLHVQRGVAGASEYYSAFRDLASPEALFRLMDGGEVPVYRVNLFRCLDGSTKETPNPPPRSPAEVRRLFAEGWSIQWLQPQQEHKALARLVAVLESQFGSLTGVNAYLTPPGVQGLAPHWDDVEVFVMQLGGEKVWSLHKTSATCALPLEAQSLPRYTSGDLPREALSPVMMQPVLTPGDLLYFPRGIIHHAPNRDTSRASVHLTISAFQRQSLFDVLSKTFEEGMAEWWEKDEALRRSVPWGSFSPKSPAYAGLCTSLAGQLRRLADAVSKEAEAATADSRASAVAGRTGGCVASALAELSADFVRHRMPPRLGSADGEDFGHIVTPSSHVSVLDPSAFALLPVPGSEDGSERLVSCLGNLQQEHMMKHPEAAEGCRGSDDEGCDEEEGGESEECEGEEEEEDDDDEEDEEEEGLEVTAHAATVLRELCAASPRSPLALAASQAPTGSAVDLQAVLQKAGVPQKAWSDVCSLLTRLAMDGLVQVGKAQASELSSTGPASGQGRKKKKSKGV